MTIDAWHLGDRSSSEALIYDLYVELRRKTIAWSKLTHQTPQARMGYIGQHLVSVVTGFPGGKSGARGHDLVVPDGYAEIKTCNRIDQLGACLKCGSPASALETKCSMCGSTALQRKSDSKWLLSIKTDQDFDQVLDPINYYLVLFEFADIDDPDNDDLMSYIWQVNPRVPGFAYCVVDYKFNIQAKSKSGAPFDLWPWQPKFYLMRPMLIYRSRIIDDGVYTEVFPNDPSVEPPFETVLPQLSNFHRSKTLRDDAVAAAIKLLGQEPLSDRAKLFEQFSEMQKELSNTDTCDALARAVFLPLIDRHLPTLPSHVRSLLPI